MITIFFSGTGNSAYIAQRFSDKMKIACHSIEENLDFNALLQAEDIIAVCYPIYGSCVPRIMREFAMKYSSILCEKKLIIFCTQMMFSGDGSHAFARLFSGCECNVIYTEHFNMPNNISNFALFPIRDSERIRKRRNANKKLEVACKNIQNGIRKRRGWGSFSTLLGKVQNSSWQSIEKKQKGSFQTDSTCNACGLCVKRCPMQNLALTSTGIMQKDNCTLCYRCVNICPQRAAMVMLHTKPKRQYKGIKV